MTDEEAKRLILDIIGEVDYDIAKDFDPELSEDPERSAEQMERLVAIVKKHVAADLDQFLVSEPRLLKSTWCPTCGNGRKFVGCRDKYHKKESAATPKKKAKARRTKK